MKTLETLSPAARELREIQSRLRNCGQRYGEACNRIETLQGEIDHLTTQRDALLKAAILAQAVIGGSDTSGSGQRQAHAALFAAISQNEASNLNTQAANTAKP